jgi:peptidyl-prolyl cis-trans isomerase C
MSGRIYLLRGLLGLALLSLLVNTSAGQQIPAFPGTTPGVVARPAAVVNGQVISQGDLDGVLKTAGPSPVPVPEGVQRQMKMQTLAMMIDEALLDQFMKANGPQVPATEVDRKLYEMSEGLKKQGKTVADFCRETGLTEAQLRANIFRTIQWFAYAEPRVTEKEMQAHYTAFKDFYDNTKVRVSHIMLLVDEKAPEAEKAKARQKLTDLRNQIIAGKITFADAAKANSQCELSKPRGGDLNLIPRKYLVHEAVARAAFALKTNEISDIVETDYGMHLLLVTERKEGPPSEYEKIKDAVRESCLIDLRQSILSQQRKASKIEINLP